jgi:hypothetical protein
MDVLLQYEDPALAVEDLVVLKKLLMDCKMQADGKTHPVNEEYANNVLGNVLHGAASEWTHAFLRLDP